MTLAAFGVDANVLLHAFGWSLFHFLWQGTIFAGALLGFLYFTRDRSSQIRYLGSCLVLGLMVLCPVGTFVYLLVNAGSSVHANSLTVHEYAGPLSFHEGGYAVSPSFFESFAATVNHEMPWILVIWSIGVLVLIAKVIVAGIIAERLKTTSLESVPEILHSMAKRVSAQLQVTQFVRLFVSSAVAGPTVVGWLRPVILFPAASLAGLAPEQLEAMLAHELAHVRRHDYLVNILQLIIEAMLFYHPAVWWVSKQIRRERENCCDDAAIVVSGSPLIYAKALYLLEEQRASAEFQLALGANGGELTMRIKRILRQKEPVVASRGMTLSLLAMAIFAICALFLFSNAAAGRARTQLEQAPFESNPSGAPHVITEVDARQHLIHYQDPIYPRIAQAARIDGNVKITILIGPIGKVISARVISGPEILRQAAMDAVIKWRFTPFQVNNSATQVTATLTIPFTLNQSDTSQNTANDNGRPDMSCGYYEGVVMHPGTCEINEQAGRQYYCRSNDDKTVSQLQIACEWKVKRLEAWELQQHQRDNK